MEAEREFRLGIELNPSSSDAHAFYAMWFLHPLGRLEEALAEMARVLETDPMDPFWHCNLGYLLYAKGRSEAAVAHYRRAIDLDPTFFFPYWMLSITCAHGGRLDEAIATAEKANDLSGGNAITIGLLGRVYGLAGRRAEAQRLLGELGGAPDTDAVKGEAKATENPRGEAVLARTYILPSRSLGLPAFPRRRAATITKSSSPCTRNITTGCALLELGCLTALILEVAMRFVRKLSPALVLVALILAGPQPGAAPEYGEWAEPVMLPGPINSVGTFGAVVSRDGLTLFCTRGNSATADILVSLRSSTDQAWGTPVTLGAPVNTAYAEMIPALSRDEHWLFFTSDRPGSESWDLWGSWRRHTRDPFGWEGPVNLGPHVNTIAQETTGSYWEGDEDGPPMLFFASNRLMISPETPNPGSLPVGHDIYASPLLEDGTFGPAVLDEQLSVRLGGVPGDMEGRPMVRFDGREIIFVSDRAGSVGAQDLWVATREEPGDPWGTPTNLAAVNTGALELHPYLSPDGRTLYFSRRGGSTPPYLYMTTRTGPGR